MKNYSILGLLLLFLISWSDLQARHIVGGEISYEFVRDSVRGTQPFKVYRFRLVIYRDCESQTQFDSAPNAGFEATVTVFREGGDRPVDGSPYYLAAPIVEQIDAGANSCLSIPDNICVERGIYEFEAVLPDTPEDYYVVYQRCCRNESITNLINPGRSGATYYINVTTEAKARNNNSPQIDMVPPLAVCIDEPLEFDFSATDIDGDSLVYSFCSPIIGGGPDQNNSTGTGGIAPNPDAPPPYNQVVQFIDGMYSVNQPLGDNANFQIDPRTGIITGRPDRFGQFAAAVCIKEYRNGLLLSETRRDFQINVVECRDAVNALVSAPDIDAEGNFLFEVCQFDTVFFINLSFDENLIEETHWQFNLENGDTLRSADWDAQLVFPDAGVFEGQLILNPNVGCGDTANLIVTVSPGLSTAFTYSYDSCAIEPIQFLLLLDQNADYTWDFGDGTTSTLLEPSHQFQQTGAQMVSLTATADGFCSSTTTQVIPYFPLPQIELDSFASKVVCENELTLFDDLVGILDDSYDVRWDFGDGTQAIGLAPAHQYALEGSYSLDLEIVSPSGCELAQTFLDVVEVLPTPVADFSFLPERPTLLNNEVVFQDQSVDAASYDWDFNGLGSSMESNPIFTFPEIGLQVVQLTVANTFGCVDSVQYSFEILPIIDLYIPNAFSPNGDDSNEVFKWEGILSETQNYQFMIWDRWGRLVFSTNNPELGWDGQDAYTGLAEPEGVYIYFIGFDGLRGRPVEYSGSVHLIR